MFLVTLLWVKQGFVSGIGISNKAVKLLKMLQHIKNRWKCGKVKEIVMNDHQIIIRKFIDDVGTSIGLYESLSDVLDKKCVIAKFVEFQIRTAVNGSCSGIAKWKEQWYKITEMYDMTLKIKFNRLVEALWITKTKKSLTSLGELNAIPKIEFQGLEKMMA